MGTPPPPEEPSPRAITYGFSSVLESNVDEEIDDLRVMRWCVAWKACDNNCCEWSSEIADMASSLRLLSVLSPFMVLSANCLSKQRRFRRAQ